APERSKGGDPGAPGYDFPRCRKEFRKRGRKTRAARRAWSRASGWGGAGGWL
ncbi:MAG: hypothetical protein AVDCRST_MAG14-651, partial [uncultured Rubrobacteraceae bacterium]